MLKYVGCSVEKRQERQVGVKRSAVTLGIEVIESLRYLDESDDDWVWSEISTDSATEMNAVIYAISLALKDKRLGLNLKVVSPEVNRSALLKLARDEKAAGVDTPVTVKYHVSKTRRTRP